MARTKKTQTPDPTQEPEATTNPAQEVQQEPQEAPAAPEAQEPAQQPEAPQEPPQAPEDATDTPPADPDPTPEADQVPAGEMPLPYKATVNVALAVVRKAVGLGTADQLKPVGTLKQGAAVTVINRKDGYAQLANGLWIDEAFLAVALNG